MPTSIYRVTPEGEANQDVAWLADNEWLLPPQVEVLQAWILESGSQLQRAYYVADIGFCWRRDASGGGSGRAPKN